MRKNTTETFLVLCFVLIVSTAHANPWAINELRGKRAPDFTTTDLTGRTHRLSDYKGRVVLLNFWATWCPPCREELRSLESLRKDYKDKRLVIIAISVDRDIEKVKRFLREISTSFIILHDGKYSVYKKYNVFSVPMTFLIDRKGRIVDIFFGEQDWTSPTIKEQIDSLL